MNIDSEELVDLDESASYVLIRKGSVEQQQVIHATLFERDFANRYAFAVTNSETGTCQYIRNESRGMPPAEVVRAMKKYRYAISNVPTISYTVGEDDAVESLRQIAALMKAVSKNYEDENHPLLVEAAVQQAVKNTENAVNLIEAQSVDDYARAAHESFKDHPMTYNGTVREILEAMAKQL